MKDLTGKTILQVIPELETGGAERTTLEMAQALIKAGAHAIVGFGWRTIGAGARGIGRNAYRAAGAF